MIKIKNNTRALVYASVLTLGTYLLIYIQPETSAKYYIVALGINLVLFTLEIISIRIISKARLVQIGLPVVNRYSKIEEAVYHQFLPLILFSSFNIFIFFNPINLLSYSLLPIVFFSFFVLFINIRAYHEDKFKLEQSTHFIYPFASIFGLFSLVNALLNITNIYDVMPFILVVIIFITIIISNFSLFIENITWNVKLITLLIFTSILVTLFAVFLYYYYESTLRTSFMTASLFYLFAALVHHKQEATLDVFVISEYLVILFLSFVLLYGIS